MKKIDRYLFTEVALPALGAELIFVVLYLGTEAMTEAGKLISRWGLPWFSVMKLLLLRMPWALAWTLPMATGMAVMLAIGRLCKDHEYTAMVAGGASFRRLMAPMLLFAALVTAGALWTQEYFAPATMMAYHVQKQSLQSTSRTDVADFMVRLSNFQQRDRVVLTAERLDTRHRKLRAPSLAVTRDGEEVYRVSAKEGEWVEAQRQWILTNGDYAIRHGDVRLDGTFDRSTAEDLAREAGFSGTMLFDMSPEEISVYGTEKSDYLIGPLIRQRIAWMRAHHYDRKEINRVVIYLHRRWTLAMSCFLFVLVGAPLAVSPQRGASKQAAFALALGMIAVYYILWQSTNLLGEGSRYPLVWAWSTNAIGFVVGLYLWRRVAD